jgi:hypothetical protein
MFPFRPGDIVAVHCTKMPAGCPSPMFQGVIAMRLVRIMGLFVATYASVCLLVPLTGEAQAQARGPCSGKKGGVSHCEGGKFVCKDGTTSRTKKICEKPPAQPS